MARIFATSLAGFWKETVWLNSILYALLISIMMSHMIYGINKE